MTIATPLPADVDLAPWEVRELEGTYALARAGLLVLLSPREGEWDVVRRLEGAAPELGHVTTPEVGILLERFARVNA